MAGAITTSAENLFARVDKLDWREVSHEVDHDGNGILEGPVDSRGMWVSRVRSGCRYTLGIIFHDAK